MTNDATPVAKKSTPFEMEVTQVDCNPKISFSSTLTDVTQTVAVVTSPLTVASGYASTVSTMACPLTYSITLVSGTVLGTWLQIDS